MDATTAATTLTGLQGETTYTVRVAALSGAGAGASVALEVTTPRAAQPATPVTPPSASDLTPEPTPGLMATPARVVAGEPVTVTGLPAHGWVQGVLFSTPVVLGWAWTGTGGSATFTIPASVSAGSHRLAVQAADGTVLGWVALEVTVPAAVPAASGLARSGMEGDLVPATVLGAMAVLVGAGLAATGLARSRRATR